MVCQVESISNVTWVFLSFTSRGRLQGAALAALLSKRIKVAVAAKATVCVQKVDFKNVDIPFIAS